MLLMKCRSKARGLLQWWVNLIIPELTALQKEPDMLLMWCSRKQRTSLILPSSPMTWIWSKLPDLNKISQHLSQGEIWASPYGSAGLRILPVMCRTWVQSLSWGFPGEGRKLHSSIMTWSYGFTVHGVTRIRLWWLSRRNPVQNDEC